MSLSVSRADRTISRDGEFHQSETETNLLYGATEQKLLSCRAASHWRRRVLLSLTGENSERGERAEIPELPRLQRTVQKSKGLIWRNRYLFSLRWLSLRLLDDAGVDMYTRHISVQAKTQEYIAVLYTNGGKGGDRSNEEEA